ncbi:UDP-N-acetylmuramoyl-L-alanine--D-glutamate ligase [Candidatus Falkowbacteria bacterium]|nr:UDP-N-acetylmuramoyl-L-alanine--D-glutamate ligase [Candidatus Falkowbacteria bacterium]
MTSIESTAAEIKGKKIALLGLGVENLALARFFLRHKIDCLITICDMRSQEQLGERFSEFAAQPNVSWKLGAEFNQGLEPFDYLFRSPGWTMACPGIKSALKNNRSVVLTSPMELFLKICPTKNTVGVTGTKGKGTTSSLIAAIIKSAGKRVWLGGNIGVAPFDFIDEIKAEDWAVLELSSFQLQGMKASPHIAVMTNFSREHLAPADPNNPNFHKTLKEYWQAKWQIAGNQQMNDYLIANKKLGKRIGKELPKGQVIYFSRLAWPSQLIGKHNQENVAAAALVADIVGINAETAQAAVKAFVGLEHRLEFVRESKGVDYFDDSFATTPEATMIALKSFRKAVILLAGGADKGADFKPLARLVAKRKVKAVILFQGQATPRLKTDLLSAGYPEGKIFLADSMPGAVSQAATLAVAGEAVVMSTACASFGLFKNYKERGELFKKEVSQLI